MTFQIHGDSGDWAEADTERAAILAARTLVNEGNARAVVIDPSGRWIGEAVGKTPTTYITTQGRRHDA